MAQHCAGSATAAQPAGGVDLTLRAAQRPKKKLLAGFRREGQARGRTWAVSHGTGARTREGSEVQGKIGERGCQWQRLGGEPRDWGRDAGRLQHRGGEGGWWARRARNSGLGGEPRDWASDTGRVGNCSAGVRSGAGGLQRFGPVGWEVSHRR